MTDGHCHVLTLQGNSRPSLIPFLPYILFLPHGFLRSQKLHLSVSVYFYHRPRKKVGYLGIASEFPKVVLKSDTLSQ